jgi:flagellar assembly factor FliW
LLKGNDMRVESRKFNTVLELDDDAVICFPHGLIGFADETRFVLLERDHSPRIAWLQSVDNPDLALPVVSCHELAEPYKNGDLGDVLDDDEEADSEDTAMMVVLTCQNGMLPTVNMVAPLVVDARTRTGKQVLLKNSRFATREPLSLRPLDDEYGPRYPMQEASAP